MGILQSASGRYYLGSTTDLDRRLAEHQRGHTHTAVHLGGELSVAAKLETPTLAEARALERFLKRKKNPQIALYLLRQRTLSG